MIVNKNATIPFELITIDLFGQIKTNITSVTVGLGTATNGTITIKGGIITAIQECTDA